MVPSHHKWWLAYSLLWGPELVIEQKTLPLPFLYLQTFPVLFFLVVFLFPWCFFSSWEFPWFFWMFCVLQVFWGFARWENPWYFGGFPWCFRKNQGKKRTGLEFELQLPLLGGLVCMSVQLHYCPASFSPSGESTNYITFTVASFIPQDLKMQSFAAAW